MRGGKAKRLWSRFIFSSRLGEEKRLKDNGLFFLELNPQCIFAKESKSSAFNCSPKLHYGSWVLWFFFLYFLNLSTQAELQGSVGELLKAGLQKWRDQWLPCPCAPGAPPPRQPQMRFHATRHGLFKQPERFQILQEQAEHSFWLQRETLKCASILHKGHGNLQNSIKPLAPLPSSIIFTNL